MTHTIKVPLSVEQIRLLAQVTLSAAQDEAQHARDSKNSNAQEQYKLRCQRLSELAEVFEKMSP